MAKAHIRFDDDIEEYEPTDSEDEYTEKEKNLLKKVKTKPSKDSESEEEVYGLEEQSSDEDDSNIAESDIEGQDDDDLPDQRAWGKSKKDFYSTDYVDPDYGGFQGKDAISAELEEEEARSIQKRLAEQLDDDDFTLDIFNKKSETAGKENDEEIIKSDLSSLSKRQILELLQKESPEFFELVEDFKDKMKNIKDYLGPIIELDKKGKITECKALEFVKTMYHLVLNYCTNIQMYLLLKASRVNIQNHPVIKRLYQYRQLLSQLEPAYVEIIKPQLEIIIEGNKENDTGNVIEKINKKKTKKLKLIETLESKKDETTKKPKKVEKKSVSFELRSTEEEKLKSSDSEPEVEEEEKEETEGEVDSKRAITYQMAKNKGLTPHRKKEQRNPRVKHRNKYRKAKIRRKGAVREVRKELTRYAGELSGIKATVTKSIKIK